MAFTRTTKGFIENVRNALFQENYEYLCTVIYDKVQRKHRRLGFPFLILCHQETGATTAFNSMAKGLLSSWCESLRRFTLFLFCVIRFYLKDFLNEHGSCKFLVVPFILSLASVFTFWGSFELQHLLIFCALRWERSGSASGKPGVEMERKQSSDLCSDVMLTRKCRSFLCGSPHCSASGLCCLTSPSYLEVKVGWWLSVMVGPKKH